MPAPGAQEFTPTPGAIHLVLVIALALVEKEKETNFQDLTCGQKAKMKHNKMYRGLTADRNRAPCLSLNAIPFLPIPANRCLPRGIEKQILSLGSDKKTEQWPRKAHRGPYRALNSEDAQQGGVNKVASKYCVRGDEKKKLSALTGIPFRSTPPPTLPHNGNNKFVSNK
jgi:hypothetical protein